MEPWYKVVTPRKEVREGRSFDPDEFAIALEQVVSGKSPEDYRNPAHFFSRTYFTRALREHAGMVLRRLAGQTENAAPVLTLITQFGGGKTHTLAALYHLARAGKDAAAFAGVSALLESARVTEVPLARVAVFVGNAWDPGPGRENPWIDVARQLAGDVGVAALGDSAKTTPPGTEALGRLFDAAGGTVLVLCDEVLNFLNRHRSMAESFHAYLQNLTVAMTGTARGAAVVSLPRSQVEMTNWDMEWQEKITKVVRRVAKDLIANDETEISEVVRRRLFEDLGSERHRKTVARTYSDWCFERRAQLPPEWMAVDTASTEKKAREHLESRFDACYPFHPATLSVFQRKWQALPQYQQTRGTLAMLAQWISLAYREAFTLARNEPLITLGSAPLEVTEFRSVVLGQLGEARLQAAIETDIAGDHAHARALDADSKGPLRDIHRRVGAAILFESSGGQVDKVAHLPELRFALGEPKVDTTSIDNTATALEQKSFFIRKVGTDGYQVRHQPTLKKVVSDRRASLDEETEIKPTIRALVRKAFERGASIPIDWFPEDGTAVTDSPKLRLVVVDPDEVYADPGSLRERLVAWTRQRGASSRLYPGALVWCVRKPGRELRDRVEMLLAWKRVQREVAEGHLGEDLGQADRSGILAEVRAADDAASDEVWATYRFILLADNSATDGVSVIDLGAGHESQAETLCGRVTGALKGAALLNESIGAGYLDRAWPEAFKLTGAWPLASLRKGFLDGSLTRLLDPDKTLRDKVPDFVTKGDLGLASGTRADGTYERVWFAEELSPDEVGFDPGVFLLKKDVAKALKAGEPAPGSAAEKHISTLPTASARASDASTVTVQEPAEGARTLRISGEVPPELWNRLGTKLLPKLRAGNDLKVGVDFVVSVSSSQAEALRADLRLLLEDLGLSDKVRIEG